jgi:hypothetical protein
MNVLTCFENRRIHGLQSTLQLRAARAAVQHAVDALEALAQGQMLDLPGPEVDAGGGSSSLRESAVDYEMLNGTTLLTMLVGDRSPFCREQAKKLAANLRNFAGLDKSS